ncbi:lipopolysaccharide biosynthesis protein [Crystallibacter degradans]|uniref:lipopolysaccharide biosynthesis protein n=1 Tax=Crystallibacter degradans TaxID=2726743 RepID=UPI003F83DD61
MRTRIRRLLSVLPYFLIPGISAVTPLLVIPALTSSYGADGWASIAVAQSVGTSAAIVAELGWSVVGPQRVAGASPGERTHLYQSSLATKLSSLAIISPLSFIFSAMLVQEHKLAAGLTGLAFSFIALSPSWFLIGCNRPFAVLGVEGLPRMILSAVAAILIFGGGALELYGLAMVLSSVLTMFLAAVLLHERVWPKWAAFRAGPRQIKEHLPLTGGRIVSVIYTSLPIALVSAVSPNSVATFAAVERLMRMALSVLGGVPSRLQSWVGVARGHNLLARSRKSLFYNLLLGLVSAIGFAALAPIVAPFIFSNAVEIPLEISSLSACVLFIVCVSRGYGLSMVAEGRANWIAAANICAAIVGVTCTLSLAAAWGVRGAIVGELLAEVTGLATQAVILHYGHRWLRKGKHEAASSRSIADPAQRRTRNSEAQQLDL